MLFKKLCPERWHQGEDYAREPSFRWLFMGLLAQGNLSIPGTKVRVMGIEKRRQFLIILQRQSV